MAKIQSTGDNQCGESEIVIHFSLEPKIAHSPWKTSYKKKQNFTANPPICTHNTYLNELKINF